MRKRQDDYDEDLQTTDYEKPQKDPVLQKLNWLIVIFIPQAIFFVALTLAAYQPFFRNYQYLRIKTVSEPVCRDSSITQRRKL